MKGSLRARSGPASVRTPAWPLQGSLRSRVTAAKLGHTGGINGRGRTCGCGAWTWVGTHSFLRLYRKYQSPAQTYLTGSHSVSPCGLDSMATIRTLTRTADV